MAFVLAWQIDCMTFIGYGVVAPGHENTSIVFYFYYSNHKMYNLYYDISTTARTTRQTFVEHC